MSMLYLLINVNLIGDKGEMTYLTKLFMEVIL